MIPPTIMTTLHNFYCILCDTEHQLELNKVLEIRNCYLIGLLTNDHSQLSVNFFSSVIIYRKYPLLLLVKIIRYFSLQRVIKIVFNGISR